MTSRPTYDEKLPQMPALNTGVSAQWLLGHSKGWCIDLVCAGLLGFDYGRVSTVRGIAYRNLCHNYWSFAGIATVSIPSQKLMTFLAFSYV